LTFGEGHEKYGLSFIVKRKRHIKLEIELFEEPGLGLGIGIWPRHDPSLVLCNIQEEALHSLVWNELILNPCQSYKTGIILVAMQCY